MDSARSCDSVISVNSACSEDSMEHLSAEEKACLMYLEETIESLDLQEDSGFSNDEPDSANLRRKHGGSETLPEPAVCENLLSVLAESGKTESSCEPDSPVLDPQSPASDLSDVPSHIPPDPTPAAQESASGSVTPVPAPLSTELSFTPNEAPERAPTEAELSAKATGDMDLSFIPPPSDFMDEPEPPTSPQNKSPASSPASKPTINLEVLRRRVSEKNMSPQSPASLSPTPASFSPKLAPINHALVSSTPSSPAHVSPATPSPALVSPASPSPTLESPASPSPAHVSPTPPSPVHASPAPQALPMTSPPMQAPPLQALPMTSPPMQAPLLQALFM
ncbi:hypothetical protein WMY93_004236 [Mugilogobius chulae]|uniref:Uncharacterized protein n=1 Tax=Mugilogobius chulae TaxID=88201 RepID=A0AAW0PN13_9GOBI